MLSDVSRETLTEIHDHLEDALVKVSSSDDFIKAAYEKYGREPSPGEAEAFLRGYLTEVIRSAEWKLRRVLQVESKEVK